MAKTVFANADALDPGLGSMLQDYVVFLCPPDLPGTPTIGTFFSKEGGNYVVARGESFDRVGVGWQNFFYGDYIWPETLKKMQREGVAGKVNFCVVLPLGIDSLYKYLIYHLEREYFRAKRLQGIRKPSLRLAENWIAKQFTRFLRHFQSETLSLVDSLGATTVAIRDVYPRRSPIDAKGGLVFLEKDRCLDYNSEFAHLWFYGNLDNFKKGTQNAIRDQLMYRAPFGVKTTALADKLMSKEENNLSHRFRQMIMVKGESLPEIETLFSELSSL